MNSDKYKCDMAIAIYNLAHETNKLEKEFENIVDNMMKDGYTKEDILKTFGLFGDITIKDKEKE